MSGAPSYAASPWQTIANPVFTRADTRELPEPAVMSLAQDRAGFVWVGTQGGLARYDGYHFRSFLPDPANPKALPDGYVRTILPNATGGVWIGSSSSGLVHFDADTETFRTWHPDRTGRNGPNSASIDALLLNDDRLWIGGEGGLGVYDLRTATFSPVALTGRRRQPVVWTLLADRAGTLWAGTQTGLYSRSAHATAFREFQPGAGASPIRSAIYSLVEDHVGRLWAGSVNALFVLDPARHGAVALRSVPQDASTLAPGQQWSVTEMSPGVVWAGTDAQFSIIDAATHHVRRIVPDAQFSGGFTNGRLMQFLHDRSGLVWIANHVGGLLSYNPLSRGLYEVSATRGDIGFGDKGAVAVLATPANHVWVGGFRGRSVEFDSRTGRIAAMSLPNRGAIQTLVAGNDGVLWFGTTSGLCRLRSGASQAECPAQPSQLAAQSIYTILAEGDQLWIGGSGGLFNDDIAKGTITEFPRAGVSRKLSNGQVRVLYRDRRRRLWVGTENGLYRFDPDGRIARFVFAPGKHDAIGPGGMAAILEDRRGRIWAGMSGGRMNVLTEDRAGKVHFQYVGVADGMPHENVDGLAEDARGRIWASTDKGIALIDPDTLHARALGIADGVSDGGYWAGSVSRATDGTMFFGGLDGVTIVAPDAESAWDHTPPVVVSTLQVGRKTIPAGSVNRGGASIDLPVTARDINVEFAALDYSAPQALRYRYKLDGYDHDWIETDSQHRIAAYTHLSPGTYTLEVRGTNRLGVWSSHVLRVSVRAKPAWFEAWWFGILVAALVVALAYALHLMRTAVLRRRQSELETIVSERTYELSEANLKLQELSVSDPLTGLRNRRFLAQHLEADVSVSLRKFQDWNGNPGAEMPQDADLVFFLVDLDYLKAVNDQYGHHAGDQILIQMRERLQEVFRESDFLVRWGGDEFLAVARASRRREAAVIAERICTVVASRAFALGGGQLIGGSVSVGFATFPFVPQAPSAVSWRQVVSLADQALYMAKESGRNMWFGLVAGARTDPDKLSQTLEANAEEAVGSGALEVISRYSKPTE